jgi:hypothetical protein
MIRRVILIFDFLVKWQNRAPHDIFCKIKKKQFPDDHTYIESALKWSVRYSEHLKKVTQKWLGTVFGGFLCFC